MSERLKGIWIGALVAILLGAIVFVCISGGLQRVKQNDLRDRAATLILEKFGEETLE